MMAFPFFPVWKGAVGMIKTEILKILRESKDYVSGQELCTGLGVSRTAIWKVMNQLKEEGYEINAISNKGYKLAAQEDVLSKEEIESRMETERIGRKVLYFNELDSTNTYAKKAAEEPDSDGTLIVADTQNAGKGRRGKTWVSFKETGIWMTIILKPKIAPKSASMLTLVAGMAVCTGISKVLQLETRIKWPNDVIINGRKICGILTEMSTEIDYINHVVVGIGVNANMEEFPEEIKQTATSLALEQGHKIMRAELIAGIMKEFEQFYHIFLETENLENLQEEYNSRLVNRGKEVVILTGDSKLEAIACGIDKDGELLVKTKDGSLQAIVAGEVSVRGVYGYI